MIQDAEKLRQLKQKMLCCKSTPDKKARKRQKKQLRRGHQIPASVRSRRTKEKGRFHSKPA